MTVLRQDTLLLYNPKECGERKKDLAFDMFILSYRLLNSARDTE